MAIVSNGRISVAMTAVSTSRLYRHGILANAKPARLFTSRPSTTMPVETSTELSANRAAGTVWNTPA
jgi:hypothetical protein